MLIRHSAVYAVAKLAPGLIGMAATAWLTRLMDPASYGLYGLALVVMTLGSTIAFDWLGLAYLRLRGETTSGAEATAMAVFGGLVAVTALGAMVAWVAGAFDGAAAGALGAGLVLMWCYAGFELASRFQVAWAQPGRYLLMNMGRAVLSAAGACVAAWLTQDPVWTALGAATGTACGIILGGFGWRGTVDPALLRAMLGFGLPLGASLALSGLATSGTRALVEVLGGAEALGLYTAAFLLVQNTLAVVAAGIASAGYSLAVRAVERGDRVAAERQLRANGTLLLTVLAPMAVGMALTAPGIAAAMVGPRYVDAVAELTPWLAAAGFFAGVRGHYLDHAFQLGKRPGLQLGVTAVAAAVAIGLTLLLVPRFDAVGAAVALTVAMASSCVHAAVTGRQAWRLPLLGGVALRVAAACAVMAVAVRLTPGGLALQVAAGIAAYAAAGVLLGLGALREPTLVERGPIPATPGQPIPYAAGRAKYIGDE